MRRNEAAKIRAVREKFPKEWEKVRELQREGKKKEAEELIRQLMRDVDAAKAKTGK